jgi:homoserine O-acetyltransferase
MPISDRAVHPEIRTVATPSDPLRLRGGGLLNTAALEVETWGRPNADRSNAVLICHSFSCDAHAAGRDGSASATHRPWRQGVPGWWDKLVGPGKAIDTDRWWVVCSGVLGGSAGSTGPQSIDPATGQPWGRSFPTIHIGDMVAAQRRLMVSLGIPRWHLVVGGSLGGAQALAWAVDGGHLAQRVVAIAASSSLSPGGRIHFRRWSERITAELNAGKDGLNALHRALADASDFSGGPGTRRTATGLAETWPVSRLHPASYILQAKALLDFDLARDWGGGSLDQAVQRIESQLLLLGYRDDGVFSSTSQARLAAAMRRHGGLAKATIVPSEDGHDSFLIRPWILGPWLRAALDDARWLEQSAPAPSLVHS